MVVSQATRRAHPDGLPAPEPPLRAPQSEHAFEPAYHRSATTSSVLYQPAWHSSCR